MSTMEKYDDLMKDLEETKKYLSGLELEVLKFKLLPLHFDFIQ